MYVWVRVCFNISKSVCTGLQALQPLGNRLVPRVLSTLFSWHRVSYWPKTHQEDYVDWPASPREPIIIISPALTEITSVCYHAELFKNGFWGSNPSPLACKSSTYQLKYFPTPRSAFWTNSEALWSGVWSEPMPLQYSQRERERESLKPRGGVSASSAFSHCVSFLQFWQCSHFSFWQALPCSLAV